MTKNKLFIFFSIFLLNGIFINNLLLDYRTSLLVLLFLVVLFLGFCFYTRKFLLLFIISIFGFILGIFVSQLNIEKINTNLNILTPYLNKEKYNIVLKIENINKIETDSITYIASIKNIENIEINKKIKSQVIIKSLSKIEKGTIIKSKVKLYELKNSPEFKYKNYMLSKSIYTKVYPYNYEVINKIKINFLESKILTFREHFLKAIKKIYTNNEAVFLGGILVGAREEVNEKLKTNFNNSGLTHFIAVSGFNITILIIFFSLLLKYFPNYIKFILISFFIILFTILVGFTAPVIRASIMGIIGYYVLLSGREGNSLSIILLTAVIMVIYSPFSLNFDISLHLSFLAVIGIIYTNSFFEKIFSFLPNMLEIRTAFTLTLSALSFSLPIIIFNFGQISLLSPLANILVSWTIPFAMLLGFMSIIVYFLFPTTGIIIGYFTRILLKWDILIVNTFGETSWAILQTNFGIYKNYYEIIYFLVLIFIIIWFRKKEEA